MSLDCMDLEIKCLFLPAGLGDGKSGTKLSHGLGHAVPEMYELERRRGWFGF